MAGARVASVFCDGLPGTSDSATLTLSESAATERSVPVVEVSDWKLDTEFYPYPEGSREKYALISPLSVKKPLVADHRYLFKLSSHRYPAQFWAEVIAYRVGRFIGVPVPPAFVAHNSSSGETAALIEWFYGPNVEKDLTVKGARIAKLARIFERLFQTPEAPATHSRYIPGSSYMARLIKDFDLAKGKQHNLYHIEVLINFLDIYGVSSWDHWAKMLTFDALIGNTDRHQDNWGVLWRADSAGRLVPRFAPAFDNGTSLGHEITEEGLAKFEDPDRLRSYVLRGIHHMKWRMADERKAGHFDLISKMIKRRPQIMRTISKTLAYNDERLFAELDKLRSLQSPVQITARRMTFVKTLISERKAQLIRCLGH